MRHAKHRFSLGRKKEHREATMAQLATALFTHGRIQTTLTKAKALRPYAEKLITHAKKGHLANDRVKWVHHFRMVLSKTRDEFATKSLMEERVTEFLERNGGYTRIYKLLPRTGDGAPMAQIELVAADDEGYPKRKRRASKPGKAAKADTTESADDAAVAAVESAVAAAATEVADAADAADEVADADEAEAAPEGSDDAEAKPEA